MFKHTLPAHTIRTYHSLIGRRINPFPQDIRAASEILAERPNEMLTADELHGHLTEYEQWRMTQMRKLRERTQQDYDSAQSASQTQMALRILQAAAQQNPQMPVLKTR